MSLPSSSDRLGAVDSLRGYAVVGVLAVHCTEVVYPASAGLLTAGTLGARGVQLFYIASAFSMFFAMQRRPIDSLFDLKNFIVRRAARLAPMFWLAMIYYLHLSGLGPRYMAPDGIGLTEVVMTFFMVHTWWPSAATSVVPGGWSVGVEVSFYLLVPLLVILVRNVWSSAVMLLLACVYSYPICVVMERAYAGTADATTVNQFATFLSLPAQIPAFAAGILLFNIHRTGFRLPKWAALTLLAASIAVMATITNVSGFWFTPAGHTVLFTNLTLFIVALLGLAGAVVLCPALPFNNVVARYLGKVSYSIYLLHIGLLSLIIPYYRASGLPMAGDLGYIVFTIIALIVIAAASTVTYRLIEKPANDWAHRLSSKKPECAVTSDLALNPIG